MNQSAPQASDANKARREMKASRAFCFVRTKDLVKSSQPQQD